MAGTDDQEVRYFDELLARARVAADSGDDIAFEALTKIRAGLDGEEAVGQAGTVALIRWGNDNLTDVTYPGSLPSSIITGLSPAKRRPTTKPLPDYILHKDDQINIAAVRAISLASKWGEDTVRGLHYGIEFKLKCLEIAVGFPYGDNAQELFVFLRKRGAATVKGHYALWARWYEDGGQAGSPIIMDLNQFCADMGYSKHHKGGFKRETRQEAMKILEGLVSVELRAVYTAKGTSKAVRLRGKLWERGIVAEQNDHYGDLLGAAREGDPNDWDPLGFTYQPGEWFMNQDWIDRNHWVGKIGAGLMKLRNDLDEWAILIGGYLGTLARKNEYCPIKLRAGHILERIDRAQSADAIRRASETQGKFERALDRLRDVAVIGSWEWAEGDVTELDDPDDPAQVADYYAAPKEQANAWRSKCVIIDLGMAADRDRFAAARPPRKALPAT